jgi:hypothetical protein
MRRPLHGGINVTPTKPKPFTLRIFLPGGTPDGLRIIEKSNWSGRGLVCPRALLPEAKNRPEFGRAGVYVLLGPPEHGDMPRVYIGQADPLRQRLEQHFKQKDFWSTAILFTSKDENLNKAHVEYLEAALATLAKDAKRCELENGNQPSPPSLSEMDLADVQGYLDEMLLCFPVLGVTIFEKPAAAAPSAVTLHLKGRGIEARGYESSQGFVVLQGSRAGKEETHSIHPYLTALRQQLVELGILAPAGDGATLVLTQDYMFSSPSTASGVMLGRNDNGRLSWKNVQGQTLKELQEQRLSPSAGAAQ